MSLPIYENITCKAMDNQLKCLYPNKKRIISLFLFNPFPYLILNQLHVELSNPPSKSKKIALSRFLFSLLATS